MNRSKSYLALTTVFFIMYTDLAGWAQLPDLSCGAVTSMIITPTPTFIDLEETEERTHHPSPAGESELYEPAVPSDLSGANNDVLTSLLNIMEASLENCRRQRRSISQCNSAGTSVDQEYLDRLNLCIKYRLADVSLLKKEINARLSGISGGGSDADRAAQRNDLKALQNQLLSHGGDVNLERDGAKETIRMAKPRPRF